MYMGDDDNDDDEWCVADSPIWDVRIAAKCCAGISCVGAMETCDGGGGVFVGVDLRLWFWRIGFGGCRGRRAGAGAGSTGYGGETGEAMK